MRVSRGSVGAIAAALIFTLASSASHAATAAEVLEGCENFPDSAYPRTCTAYFVEIMDFLGSDDRMINPGGRLCLDEDLTAAEVIPVVVEWIKQHPGQASISAFDAAHNALSPQYRCR